MTINDSALSLKNRINNANPNTLASAAQALKLGTVLRTIGVQLYAQAPAADPYSLATVQVIKLPDDAKAYSIATAYARVGTAAAGPLTVVAAGTTPATTQCAVTPNGDLAFLASDAYTSVDVVYHPMAYDIVELSLAVASNAIAIPAGMTCIAILEAEALTATSGGLKIVTGPSASVAAAGTARLDLAKANVKFNGADAVTFARVKLAIAPATSTTAQLESTSTGVL